MSAGATWPVDLWLDRLKNGGRMILALTKNKDTAGAWFLIERRGDGFLAKGISAAGLFPCEGGRDAESKRALVAAPEKGGWERVTRLYRRADVPEQQCWLKGPDWCLPALRLRSRDVRASSVFRSLSDVDSLARSHKRMAWMQARGSCELVVAL